MSKRIESPVIGLCALISLPYIHGDTIDTDHRYQLDNLLDEGRDWNWYDDTLSEL
jgi:hypothetical protein